MKLCEAGLIVIIAIMAIVLGAHSFSQKIRNFSICRKHQILNEYQAKKVARSSRVFSEHVHYHYNMQETKPTQKKAGP